MEQQLQKTYPRDVFMHLLNTTALYVSVFSVLNLCFDYINVAFPDALNPYYDPSGSVRWALSLFIIIFGVFVWTTRFIEKDLVKNPEKNNLRIRRWLVYLTIFLAAALLIGDLVALIYNFLGGELTLPFILKLFAVLVTGGAVFWFYLYELKKKPGEFSLAARVIIWIAIFLAAAITVYGFFIAGSPFRARLVRFDEQKTNDLQNIQGQIVNYWQQKNKLPQALGDLTDSISGFRAPFDPQTEESYAYRVTGGLSFNLCANFNLESDNRRTSAALPVAPYPYKGVLDSWSHGAGSVCFARTIDPELYKPAKR